LADISVSAGSACASGAATKSYVLEALHHDSQRAVVRFSFSKFNTVDEIKYVVKKLKEIYNSI
jgi:cysteine desulfurase